jgi:hypothetical protein
VCVNLTVTFDRDDEGSPNAFTVEHGNLKLTLGKIRTSFPLPGDYHFRFKVKLEGTYIWVDHVDDATVVPFYEGLVFCKASRLDWGGKTQHPPPQRRLSKRQEEVLGTNQERPGLRVNSADDDGTRP